jgi:hypothetical protein
LSQPTIFHFCHWLLTCAFGWLVDLQQWRLGELLWETDEAGQIAGTKAIAMEWYKLSAEKGTTDERANL